MITCYRREESRNRQNNSVDNISITLFRFLMHDKIEMLQNKFCILKLPCRLLQIYMVKMLLFYLLDIERNLTFPAKPVLRILIGSSDEFGVQNFIL